MDFKTEVPIYKQSPAINHQAKIALFGSCFVENIGAKLAYFKFNTCQNPFGIIFNPEAIARLFEKMAAAYQYSEKDIFYNNEQFSCYDVHSSLNRSSAESYLKNLNSIIDAVSHFLKQASHVVLTLGTAWSYEHIETEKIVANCHKIPQQNFNKKLLSTQEIKMALEKISKTLWKWNPDCKIIVTISPVRHLKDGFTENQQSKAHLLIGFKDYADSLSAAAKNKLAYFPSYEIMMDELRDYRFYADDMVHPSNLAVSYIWEKFKEAWIAEETKSVLLEIDRIQKGLHHRPFNENSQSHQKFLAKLEQRIQQLKNKVPIIDF